MIDWIPALVLLKNYQGDWDIYLEILYDYFKSDFVYSSPKFHGETLRLKRMPYYNNKETTFWHLIAEGPNESDRLPDLRRCERIRWPRPTIEHSEVEAVKVWENLRGSEVRICLWIEEVDYLVVLARRKGYLLPWTAYPVDQDHTRRKLRKEYEAYKKTNAAQET